MILMNQIKQKIEWNVVLNNEGFKVGIRYFVINMIVFDQSKVSTRTTTTVEKLIRLFIYATYLKGNDTKVSSFDNSAD